jgi:type II secretory pathway pseudopilin PulG
MKETRNDQSGFTILEVAVASIITMVGLLFLASLFTLAIGQNNLVKQYTTTLALAQQKLEELNALEREDARFGVGGGLTEGTKANGYSDVVYVDPNTGTITTEIPESQTPIYARYWLIENDPQLTNTKLISVRVVALQASQGRTAEETTLTTARSW